MQKKNNEFPHATNHFVSTITSILIITVAHCSIASLNCISSLLLTYFENTWKSLFSSKWTYHGGASLCKLPR